MLLTDAQYDTLLAFADAHWADPACPICGGNEWIIPRQIYRMEPLGPGAPVLPVAVFGCKVCGNLRFLSLTVAGISLGDAPSLAGTPAPDPSDMWGKVFDLERKKAVDLGDFKLFVMPDDYIGASILSSGVYEHHVTAVLREVLKGGDVFLDLGANLGYFTMLGAKLVGAGGKVIAFEPNAQNVQLLSASILLNGFRHVQVQPFAVSDQATILKFITVGSNGGVVTPLSGPVNLRDHAREFTCLVQSVVLDQVLAHEPRIDVVKMDIEAHEPAALRGMKALIARHRPVILTEFHPSALAGNNPEPPRAYLETLADLGYSLAVIPFDGPLQAPAGVDGVMAYWEKLSSKDPQIHVDLLARPI